MAQPVLATKVCSKCGVEKLRGEFRARKGSRDGLHGWCHPCYNGYYSKASREWREKNRERQRANSRRLYWANPERGREYKRRYDEANRETVREAARRYYRNHHEESVERARRYREENRDEVNKRQRQRYADNPALYRARAKRRYVVAHAAASEVVERYEECLTLPCAYCGSTENIEVDHIHPVAKGGLTVPENLAPACLPCNRSKGHKLVSEWKGR